MYLTGQVDWLPKTYPEDLAPRLMQRADFYAVPGLVVYFYRLNCQRPPFNDRRVRKAINLAIDRRVITRDVLGRGELPAYHFVPPGMPGYQRPKTGIAFDVPKARMLLAAAGYPGGKDFPEVGILYNTFEQHKKIAEVIADQLGRHLNIRVEAYNQEWQSYLATVRSIDYDIARAGWIGDYRDPNTFLDMWVTNGGSNETGFASPAYDLLVRAAGNVPGYLERKGAILEVVQDRARMIRLLEAASQPGTRQPEAQQDLRMALMSELEAMLVQQEFPIVPIYFYVNSGMVRPTVRGFHTSLEFKDGRSAPNLQDIHPLYAVYKD
jgi:oligopeptide transport system substrate-binding protein